MNPIKHLWYSLKLKLNSYPTKAKRIQKVWQRVEEQWATFTKKNCQKYIDSILVKIDAAIKVLILFFMYPEKWSGCIQRFLSQIILTPSIQSFYESALIINIVLSF